jgi:hypothetical protein
MNILCKFLYKKDVNGNAEREKKLCRAEEEKEKYSKM